MTAENVTEIIDTPLPRERGRLEYLDGLRGLAALCVVVGHCTQFSQDAYGDHANQGLNIFRVFSSLSVPLFIILSGFCLALPLVRDGGLPGGWRGFYRRRAWRILPVYYVALTVALVYAVLRSHTVTDHDVRVLGPNVLGPLLLMHDFYGQPVVNSPLWSIAVEWHIYFLFPLLLLGWRRWGALRTTAVVVPLSYIATAVAVHNHGERMHFYLYGLFALGAVVAWVCFSTNPDCRSLRGHRAWPTVWAAASAAFATYCILLGWQGYLLTEACVDLLWGGCVCCLLMALVSPVPFRLRDALLSRPMQAVGACSYSLYAVHWVVVLAVNAALLPLAARIGNGLYFVLLTLLAVPGSLLAAGVTYVLVERPSLRARRLTSTPGEGVGRVRATPLGPEAAPEPSRGTSA